VLTGTFPLGPRGNGFNPVFDDRFEIPFEVVGGMLGLVFVRFMVTDRDDKCMGKYCASAAALNPGELGVICLIFSLFVLLIMGRVTLERIPPCTAV
jgi:hypothetical protein